jgi:hypothetical protein
MWMSSRHWRRDLPWLTTAHLVADADPSPLSASDTALLRSTPLRLDAGDTLLAALLGMAWAPLPPRHAGPDVARTSLQRTI